MENTEREFFINRIVSGRLYFNIGNNEYYLDNLDKHQKYQSQIIYNNAVREAELNGVWDELEILEMMLVNNFWNSVKEQLLIEHQKNIEEFKVALYESEFHSNSRFAIRNKLNVAKKELDKLTNERHSFDYLSTKSIGLMAKLHYTICNTLYYSDGRKVYNGDEWKNGVINNLDMIIDYINSSRLNETQYRELARTEPWRMMWTASKNNNLFSTASVDLTEEQKLLVFWSRLYDQIHESSEAPGDSVIEDDDMLDGWLIKQRRLREKDKLKQAGEKLARNSRINNADEVFIMAETMEDAKRIYAMNDAAAEVARKTTFALMNKHGSIEHKKLPHVQQLVMQRATQALHQHGRG